MYLMESPEEAQRLLAQQRNSEALRLLGMTGLEPGARALDAGCGPGAITEAMAELVGERGQVTALDLSQERLLEARRLCAHRPNVSLVQADVRSTGLPQDSFDYTFCQFVLQYLPDRHLAVQELVRLTRPGGKVVLSDIDGFGLSNWPFPDSLRQGSQRFLEALEQHGFDLFVGRKLYAELRQAGVQELRVHVLPYYSLAGAAGEHHLQDWRVRFRALEPVVAPALGGPQPYWAWCHGYLDMLADPGTFKYAVQLVTEGRKP